MLYICFIYSIVYIYIYAIYIRAFPTILQLLLLAPHSAAPTLPAAFSISPNAEEAAAATTATVAGANKCQVEQRRQRRGRGKGAWQGGAGPGSDWQQAARQVAADLAFFYCVDSISLAAFRLLLLLLLLLIGCCCCCCCLLLLLLSFRYANHSKSALNY